jgi:hypothetical protein
MQDTESIGAEKKRQGTEKRKWAGDLLAKTANV